MVMLSDEPQVDPELQEHVQTYRRFVKYSAIFVGHVAVILLLLGWWFKDAFV
jgi:hypothetical protein